MQYREAHLRRLADRLGFTYSPGAVPGLMELIADFRLAARGNKPAVTNVLRGPGGPDVYLFDYSYKDFGRKRTVHQSVCFIHSQQLVLPEMCLQPEGAMHKLGELFGFHDIDFTRFPKFSRQYRLTGEDEDYIRHHFSDAVLNYFTLHKGWSVEGLGFYLLLYKKGVLLPPEEVESLYHRALEVHAGFSTASEC